MQFHFDGSPAFALKDHVTGNPVPLPEYVKGVRNGAAAYTMNTLPHINVVLRKLPGFTPGAYAIGATGSLGGVRRQHVTPSFQPSGLTAPIDFQPSPPPHHTANGSRCSPPTANSRATATP